MATDTNLPAKNGMGIGGKLAAINPQSFEDVQRIAIMAVKAGLYPKAKVKWGEAEEDAETAVAKATMAIMQGMECGIPAMQAVQGIAIVNGRAMMYGDLLTALLWSKGFKVKKWTEGEGDAMKGCARITRPDGEVIEKEYSVANAKKAKLWDEREKTKRKGKNGDYEAPNDAPWHRFAERMLEWRAFGYCVKDGASDATHGMMVTEEAAPEFNEPAIDITPADIPEPAAPPPRKKPEPAQLQLEPAKEADTKPEAKTESKAEPKAKAKNEPAKKAAEPEPEAEDNSVTDPDAYVDEFETKVAECQGDVDALEQVWAEHVPYIASIPSEHRGRCKAAFEEGGGEIP